MPEHGPQPPAPAGGGYQGTPPPQPGPYGFPTAGYPAVPPGQPYGMPPRSTNTMAILALVFAFVVAPLGIVFGAIGLKQTRERGEDGRRLALAGVIVGSVLTGISVIMLVFASVVAGSAVSAMNASVNRLSDSTSAPSGDGCASSSPCAPQADSATATSSSSSASLDADMVVCRQVEPAVAAAEASLESGSAVSGHDLIAQLQATTLTVRRSGIPPRLDGGFDNDFNMLDSSLATLIDQADGGLSNGSLDTGLRNAAAPLDNWCTQIGYQP